MRSAIARSLGKLSVVLVVALTAGLAIANSQARSQTPGRASAPPAALDKSSAVGALPDIVGFRPGISREEAYKLLKAYSPTATIRVGQVQVPEISYQPIPAKLLLQSAAPRGMEATEIIQLELTLPPEKPVVWGILRRLLWGAGKERNRTALIAELRRQYGQAVEGDGLAVPVLSLHWAFDERGRRETGGVAVGCALPGAWDAPNQGKAGATSSTFPADSLLLGRPGLNQAQCQPLIYVTALFQPSGRGGLELIESMTVTIINRALAARAQAATAAYRVEAIERRKK